MTQDEIIEALEENKQQAQEESLPNGSSSRSKPEASSLDTKIVQIVMNGDLPEITYNNMSIAEVLGALRLAQELVLNKQVHTPMLKYSLGRIAETL